jgi:hypothetical protein
MSTGDPTSAHYEKYSNVSEVHEITFMAVT